MQKDYDKILFDHYQRVAKLNGLAGTCSMEDPYIRESETNFFLKEIDRFCAQNTGAPLTLLDVGCGNGYLLNRIRERFPEIKLLGLEFVPELFELALSRAITNCTLALGDARELSFFPSNVDLIVTERSVINVMNRQDQLLLLQNIASTLRPDGLYIQVESYREPLDLLNQARREMVITDEIEESGHNLYLSENIIAPMAQMGLVEVEATYPPNYLSTHFYVSRVFHKAVLPKGGKVKYSLFAEFFREALPAAVGNFSPILFRVFKKS
ncbi:MAG: hypothetical protein A2X86_06355 [Bdellovibrionales bacterium GWA2_49_15]|nr:MAG: hypothetical protein A2X86_06355 [Bdellovibrionales bacterium GWA2_49_15]HAZ12106.1 hypothetical protein [Bdellovibrionales bacterium]